MANCTNTYTTYSTTEEAIDSFPIKIRKVLIKEEGEEEVGRPFIKCVSPNSKREGLKFISERRKRNGKGWLNSLKSFVKKTKVYR